MTTMFNWARDVRYDDAAKLRFHNAARKVLRGVASGLCLKPGEYDLRSNKAGPAVSGEVTLHSDRIYIQVSQSGMGYNLSILIRTCKNRRDYTGGQNTFLSLSAMTDPQQIVNRARALMSPQTEEV